MKGIMMAVRMKLFLSATEIVNVNKSGSFAIIIAT